MKSLDEIRKLRPLDAEARREVEAMKRAMEEECRMASTSAQMGVDLVADEPPGPADTMAG